MIRNSYNTKPDTNWYQSLNDMVADEVRGYFKFIVKSGENISPYNIWWKGAGENLIITKHDMPKEEFKKYQDEIMRKARINSNDSYKEVMNAYVSEKI